MIEERVGETLHTVELQTFNKDGKTRYRTVCSCGKVRELLGRGSDGNGDFRPLWKSDPAWLFPVCPVNPELKHLPMPT